MRVIVTRPEEDAGPLRTKLEALGHQPVVAPLLAIVPRLDVRIPGRPYQAVVATSANGIRALPGNAVAKSLRMLTVGPQSAAAARQAGFTNVEVHGGDVHGLTAHLRTASRPADGPILYLSGATAAGNLHGELTQAGFDVNRVILYDAVPASSLGAAATSLRHREADAVLLYSPRSARIWSALVEREGLAVEAAKSRYFCLSANVAAMLPQPWAKSVAERPDEDAMLALLELPARTD